MRDKIKEVIERIVKKDAADICPIHECAWIDPKKIPFSADVRAACAANRCGKYASNWTCPPGVGDWEELRDRYQAYGSAFVFTTCHALEDSFDIEGIEEGHRLHRRLDDYIAEELREFAGQFVHLGVGCCNLCPKCTYPDAPCRFPGKARAAMEACGMDVVSLSRICGIKYMNGADTVTYFSILIF